MAKLSTLERAKRFFKRIDHWSGSNSYAPGAFDEEFLEWKLPRLWCQARAYRALLKSAYKQVGNGPIGPLHDAGWREGLTYALELHDAIYGRKEKG